MALLSSAQLLDLCERGRAMAPVPRALLLLGAVFPDESAEALAALPVGRRDSRLLEVRELTLGPTLEVETPCPACEERLEFELQGADLRAAAPADDSATSVEVHCDGYRVSARLPTSRDVMAAADPDALMARCLLEVLDPAGAPAEGLPPGVFAATAEAMTEADPLSDVTVDLDCPACGHTWQVPLDLAAFVWTELEAAAPRVLLDVHRLAQAYGWAERDVLGMSAWRRDQYLRLLAS